MGFAVSIVAKLSIELSYNILRTLRGLPVTVLYDGACEVDSFQKYMY